MTTPNDQTKAAGREADAAREARDRKDESKGMERHEGFCFRNPNNRACVTCRFFGKDFETVYNPHHNGDPGSTDYEEEFRYCERDIDLTAKLKSGCTLWQPKEQNEQNQ